LVIRADPTPVRFPDAIERSADRIIVGIINGNRYTLPAGFARAGVSATSRRLRSVRPE
jgi:hypothetical protein